MVVRRVIFFFIYFLNLGRPNMSKDSHAKLAERFYRVLDKKWWRFLRRRPFVSIYSFIKYYIKFLVAKGFDAESTTSDRLHIEGLVSNFSSFFKMLDKTLYF